MTAIAKAIVLKTCVNNCFRQKFSSPQLVKSITDLIAASIKTQAVITKNWVGKYLM